MIITTPLHYQSIMLICPLIGTIRPVRCVNLIYTLIAPIILESKFLADYLLVVIALVDMHKLSLLSLLSLLLRETGSIRLKAAPPRG